MKKRITIVSLLFALAIGFGIYRASSQSKLRDFRLSAAQNEALAESDKILEQLDQQTRSAFAQKQSLVIGFAISSGIKRDDLPKFKLEKQADGYHLVERTPDEIQKDQPQQ